MEFQESSRISALFPCYNENRNIRTLVKNAVQALKSLNCDYEIIIVNDGSTDGTREIVERISEENPKIRCINHSKNRGYGASLYTGFQHCQYEYIFFSDADNQFDLSEIRLLVNKIHEADLVTGYRHSRADSALRLLNAWGWRLLVRLFFGIRITDIDCAFKLFKKETIERICTPNMISKGALINTEIYARMKRLGMKVIEVPVTHYARIEGHATGAKISVIVNALRELIKLYLKLHHEGLEIRTEKPSVKELTHV